MGGWHGRGHLLRPPFQRHRKQGGDLREPVGEEPGGLGPQPSLPAPRPGLRFPEKGGALPRSLSAWVAKQGQDHDFLKLPPAPHSPAPALPPPSWHSYLQHWPGELGTTQLCATCRGYVEDLAPLSQVPLPTPPCPTCGLSASPRPQLRAPCSGPAARPPGPLPVTGWGCYCRWEDEAGPAVLRLLYH